MAHAALPSLSEPLRLMKLSCTSLIQSCGMMMYPQILLFTLRWLMRNCFSPCRPCGLPRHTQHATPRSLLLWFPAHMRFGASNDILPSDTFFNRSRSASCRFIIQEFSSVLTFLHSPSYLAGQFQYTVDDTDRLSVYPCSV